jgi:glycerol-3-phosphate dehydrogenase (NAD(P)+)
VSKIAIIGSGSWGVALAIYLAKQNHDIKIWSFSKEEADIINIEKKCKFLPEAVVPDNVYCSLDFKEVIEESEYILIVTPSKFVRETISKFKEYVTNQYIIICSKGFEQGTQKTLGEVVQEELPNNKVGILSGPSHAEEVSKDIPTAMVIASENEELKNKIQQQFFSETVRIYTSDDVKGVELRWCNKKHYCILRRYCKWNGLRR